MKRMKLLATTVLSFSLLVLVSAHPGQAQVSPSDTEPEQSIEVIRNGSQLSQVGSAEYFTGFALIDPLVDVRDSGFQLYRLKSEKPKNAHCDEE